MSMVPHGVLVAMVQTALAGYSARAPCPHPATQSHPSLGRLPARRARSQSAMVHREANGHIPLVPTSRAEIANRRSSDASRAALPSGSDAESMLSGRVELQEPMSPQQPPRPCAGKPCRVRSTAQARGSQAKSKAFVVIQQAPAGGATRSPLSVDNADT